MFFKKIRAHSVTYRNLVAGKFEIQTCFLQHRGSNVIAVGKFVLRITRILAAPAMSTSPDIVLLPSPPKIFT